eukprot:5881642-Pyramimonas_sp.AAC.4
MERVCGFLSKRRLGRVEGGAVRYSTVSVSFQLAYTTRTARRSRGLLSQRGESGNEQTHLGSVCEVEAVSKTDVRP